MLSAFVLSFLLIPPALRYLPFPKTKTPAHDSSAHGRGSWADRIADSIYVRRPLVWAIALIILALSAFGITRVWINSSFLDKFERDSAIVQADRFINRHFGGTSTLNVVLEAQQQGALKQPAVLYLMDSLQHQAEGQVHGLDVMRKVYNREVGGDMQAELRMTLQNAHGRTRVRALRQWIKYGDEVDKKLMIFVEPADVRNTALMNWSYKEEGREDDQWIYLPALKRIKRISSGSRSDYFMGSDFTYDDLGERHPSEDTHTLLRREELDGEKCLVVESVPKKDGAMYSRTLTWVAEGKWIGLKKDFYDPEGKLLKTLRIKKHQKVDEFWTILATEMHNVQKDHTTRMELTNVSYDNGLSDAMFNERTMRRGVR